MYFRNKLPFHLLHGLPWWQQRLKNLPASSGDVGLIPGLGRSLGEGNGSPLQYSCLGNSMDRGAWQATVHGVTRVDLITKYHHLLYC